MHPHRACGMEARRIRRHLRQRQRGLSDHCVTAAQPSELLGLEDSPQQLAQQHFAENSGQLSRLC